MKKRFLSILLAFAMVISFVPVTYASAEGAVNLPQNAYTISVDTVQYGDITVSGTYKADDDTTVYAFSGDTVTVTVKPNDGYAVKSVKYNGETVEIGENTGSFTMPATNVTITATFAQIEYSVTYDPGKGSGRTNGVKVVQGQSYILSTAGANGYRGPEGKVFKEWALGSENGERYAAGSTYVITGNVTFYAIWEDGYTVSFNANGGTGIKDDVTVAKGSSYKLPQSGVGSFDAPTGKLFKTWAAGSVDGEQYAAGSTYIVNSDITFYAIWKDGCLVTFDPKGGDRSSPPRTVEKGSKIATPLTPQKSGYTFGGWFGAYGISDDTSDIFTDKYKWDFENDTVEGDFTLYAKWTKKSASSGSNNSGSVGGGSDSSASTTTKTETDTSTVTGTDGSTTTTKTTTTTTTNADGSSTVIENKTATTEGADGSTTKVETKTVTTTDADGKKSEVVTQEIEMNTADGSTGSTSVAADGTMSATAMLSDDAVSAAAADGAAISVPIPAIDDSVGATVTVNLPSSVEQADVSFPVEDAGEGTVVILVDADGTETILVNSVVDENGVAANIPNGATVKVVDNSVSFPDVKAGDWQKDAVDFVSARGIMNGVGDGFSLTSSTTRGQFMTVLARLAGVNTTPKAGESWFAAGQRWAMENGISDGTNPESEITREQMMTMLWRMKGEPASDHSVSHFDDADQISDWAADANKWANANGVINGNGSGKLNPRASTARGEMAQIMMNMIKNLGI